MPRASQSRPRFVWALFRGQCRRRLLVGLAFMLVAGLYGTYAAYGLSVRGHDADHLDQPLVRLAQRLVPLPLQLRGLTPQNNRELYLLAVIGDQHDMLRALTLFILRMIATVTIGGLGIVLVAAGSVEWETRSEGT